MYYGPTKELQQFQQRVYKLLKKNIPDECLRAELAWHVSKFAVDYADKIARKYCKV